MMRIYRFIAEQLSELRLPESQYFKVSRRIALSTMIQRPDDIMRSFALHRYEGTLGNLLERRFALTKDKNSREYGVLIDTKGDPEEAQKRLEPYFDAIVERAAYERKNYVSYLKELLKNSPNKIALSDQDIHGTAQQCVIKLLDEGRDFHGL